MSKNQITSYWRRQGVKIGDRCYIEPDVKFGSEPYLISIGDHVRLSSNVQFVTHDGSLWVLRELSHDLQNIDKFGEIKIGNNVNIGWNTVIMPGVKIGDNCIIGLGSIVTRDIPANSVAVGSPARVIRTIEEFREKNKESFVNTKNLDYNEKKQFLLKYFNISDK